MKTAAVPPNRMMRTIRSSIVAGLLILCVAGETLAQTPLITPSGIVNSARGCVSDAGIRDLREECPFGIGGILERRDQLTNAGRFERPADHFVAGDLQYHAAALGLLRLGGLDK